MTNIISLVFQQGQFQKELSDAIPSSFHFSCENNQMILYVPKETVLASILHFKYLNGCDGLQRIWTIEENSSVKIVEEYTHDHEKAYATNTQLNVQLNKFSNMKYHKIQSENQKAHHQGTIHVEQRESSSASMFFVDCGGNQSSSTINVLLSERDATCHMHGIYFLNHDEQNIENEVYVEHTAEHGTSAMVFKGVLDKKSKARFQGRVHVHEKAKHTNAHQQNNNLLLSSLAEVGTKPQLEIYANDVKCTHGATVGQLDQDALFYLCSRGIDAEIALKMLTDAFVAEIMEKIEDPFIRNYVRQRVAQHDAF